MKPGLPEQDQATAPVIECISAITLATHDMACAVQFYRSLGFVLRYGGESASFSSFVAGTSYLNLIAQPAERRWSLQALALGLHPEHAPRDAPWGELLPSDRCGRP